MTETTPITLADATATDRLAQRFARILRPGDVVLLSGPVGAAKTHFARAVIRALTSEAQEVPSPTFTLIQTYDSTAGEIWHADLYRLGDPGEIEELGLTDAFEQAICLIEWPDRLGDLRPANALEVTLSYRSEDEGRDVRFGWRSGDWQRRLTDVIA